MKKSLLLVSVFLIAGIVYSQQGEFMESKKSKMPVTDTAKQKSTFWDAFAANYKQEIKNQDSLKKIRYEKKAYTSTYLKANGIMPNADALALIGKLNPNLGDSVSYGVHLKFPDLEKGTGEERKELRRKFREINRYDRDGHSLFKQQSTKFSIAYSGLKEIKLGADSASHLKQFWVILNGMNEFLNENKNTRLSRGRHQVLNKNLGTVLKVLEKCTAAKRIRHNDLLILQACSRSISSESKNKAEAAQKKGLSFLYQRKQGKQKGFIAAALPAEYMEVYFGAPSTSSFFFKEDVNKKCYIYALTADEDGGDPIELQHHYTYAYMSAGDALWDREYNNKSGFTDEDEDVSYSLLEIAVADYIFRFTEKATGKVHWRCYSEGDFKINDSQGNAIGKNKVRIIFNPAVADCTNWIW